MASQEQQPVSPPGFPLDRLPPELRDYIWILTLPYCRFIRVNGIKRQGHQSETMFFHFDDTCPHPIALSVCRESRGAALRQGFIFKAADKESLGLWFRPDTDILYFSRKHQKTLSTKTHIHIPGWDRVLHFGIELDAFYFDNSVFSPPPENLAEIMEGFYAHMPNLKRLSLIVGDEYLTGRCQALIVPIPLPGSDENTYAIMRGRIIWEVFEGFMNSKMSEREGWCMMLRPDGNRPH
ncbi:hypothetical protein FSHL1_006174 [Fusarium sambucinum]